jgi:hypothetical protein
MAEELDFEESSDFLAEKGEEPTETDETQEVLEFAEPEETQEAVDFTQ